MSRGDTYPVSARAAKRLEFVFERGDLDPPVAVRPFRALHDSEEGAIARNLVRSRRASIASSNRPCARRTSAKPKSAVAVGS